MDIGSPKQLLSRLALVLAGLALPLLFFNFGARIFGQGPLTPAEQNLVLNLGHFGYENLHALCRLGRHMPRAPNEIAVFGASSVEGAFATPGKDFSRLLHSTLKKQAPGKWAVHNLGRSGKTSFWMKECMKVAGQEGARIWVAYEGHNDFADTVVTGTRKSLFFLRNPGVTEWVSGVLQSGASGWLRPFIKVRGPRIEKEVLEREVAAALEASEANYREMIASARAANAKLVLATVISNLASLPGYGLATGYPDGLSAAAAFRKAEESFASGKKAEALSLYRLARDRDPQMWRAPSAFNEMLRRLAAENPEVQLLDLEKSFEAEFAQDRKLGCEFFGSATYCDHVHPNDFTHSWIAGKLEKALFPDGAK